MRTTYELHVEVEDSELRERYDSYIAQRRETNCSDSGFDLFVPEHVLYESGEYVMIDHKIKCQMTLYGQKTGYLLHPRSSTAKKYNLMMGNNTGVIDADYRGNIKAYMFSPLTRGDLDTNSTKVSQVDKHSRVVQLCAPDYKPFNVIIVDKVDKTQRGDGGFGSTGK